MSRQAHGQFREPHAREGDKSALASHADESVMMALALAQRRFEATFHHAPVGIAHVAMDGQFLLVNPRFCAISGYSAQALIDTGFQQITHPDDLDADQALLARLHAGEIPRYTMEKRYIRPGGDIVWINLTVAMVRDAADQPEFYVAVIEDLSDLRQASFEAVHDPLTGLFNRRGLAAQWEGLLACGAAEGPMISLLFLDLDGFKQLNDSHGHAVGDACLVDVARMLGAQVRSQDVVARIGGDEFVMLLPDMDTAEAQALGERVRHGLANQTFGGDHGISGSFGLVTASGATDIDRLIDCADGAMLAAKRAGRNRLLVAAYR
ncbi:MAG: diguanylate cyclase [bacterium]|nr:diguanylate cyclase [bacterium]